MVEVRKKAVGSICSPGSSECRRRTIDGGVRVIHTYSSGLTVAMSNVSLTVIEY